VQGDGAISAGARYWRPHLPAGANQNDAQSTPVGSSGFAPAMQYRTSLQPRLDANTVDLDVERANFAENTVRYERAAFIQRPDSARCSPQSWPVIDAADCYSLHRVDVA